MELCRSVDWMDAMLLLLDVADGGRPVVDEEQSGEMTTTTPLELVEEASSSSDSEVGYSLAASGASCVDVLFWVAPAFIMDHSSSFLDGLQTPSNQTHIIIFGGQTTLRIILREIRENVHARSTWRALPSTWN